MIQAFVGKKSDRTHWTAALTKPLSSRPQSITEANETRNCTSRRAVVENKNRELKRFLLLKNECSHSKIQSQVNYFGVHRKYSMIYFIFQFCDGCVRVVCAIQNYKFLADTDRSRPMDMSPINAKLSLQRALCFKNFVQKPEKEFDNFLKTHFDSILDFRKKTHWKLVPVDNCREYLDFPPVIHTGKGESANEISC